ncbi:MAG TPA: hypothetical protein VHA56_21225 [Mucilaginibacter sp.]|nr:hypothetical protein [Mucilaginibacter sp.]
MITSKSSVFLLIGVAFLAACITGCDSKSPDKCTPCPAILQLAPNLNFRVVDKATNTDLFFNDPAEYAISDLKMHQLINGHPDTVFLSVDTENKRFNVRVNPVGQIDTVIMKVGNKSQDTLLFSIATTKGCCSTTYLNTVSYNGVVVYTHDKGPEVAVLAK